MKIALILAGLLAVAMIAPATAQAPSGTKAYCLKLADGTTTCAYDTMAQCQEAMKGKTGSGCAPRPG